MKKIIVAVVVAVTGAVAFFSRDKIAEKVKAHV